jgi:hypothetical protein
MSTKNLSRRDFIRKSAATGIVLSSVPSLAGSTPAAKTGPTEIPSALNIQYGVLDSKIFRLPGSEYRGSPLWFFNDRIDINDSLEQLREMHSLGWGLVLPRKYNGVLDEPYGEKWNEMMHAVLKACETINMKVFLQENNVPFPEVKKEYGLKMLVKRPAADKVRENERLIYREGNYAYYENLAALGSEKSTAFRALDTLNREAVSAYAEAVIGYLMKNFGYAFDKVVDAMWVDEPRARNAAGLPKESVAWTTDLPAIFEKEWGYPIIENLPCLFEDVKDYKKVRHHYWRTVCSLFTNIYWKNMDEICTKHKIKFGGHQYGEDTFARQMEYTINCMPHYEYMPRPGIDHLTGTLTWPRFDRKGYPFILCPLQASSVAHQLGKKEVLAEMYGVSDQGTSFMDRKWIFDWLAVLGINYRVYHGAFYSLRGLRKRIYPMTFNYQQPWWKGNRIIADYGARLSYALRQGKVSADILLIHSMESFYMEAALGKFDFESTGQLNMDFVNISHNLLKIQRSHDYGDESLIAKYGKVSKGIFSVGDMNYKIVILPSISTLRKSTVKLLNAFLDNGGSVISTGAIPTMIDGETTDQINLLTKRIKKIDNQPDALKSQLDKILPAHLILKALNGDSADKIWIQERDCGERQLFFLAHTDKEGDKRIETEFSVKGNGTLECWNLENGKVEPISQKRNGEFISVKLPFLPAQSHLIILNKTAGKNVIPEEYPVKGWSVGVDSYEVRRKDPNALTLDFCRYKKGDGDWSEVLPVIGISELLQREKYNGAVSLQFKFDAQYVPKQCSVVIERAAGYSVLVNNAKVAYDGLPYYRDKSFHPIDITSSIKQGTNQIELSTAFHAPDPNLDYDERAYGTELENIYLIGDFAVNGEKIGEDWFESPRHRYKPQFTIIKETGKCSGDLLKEGYSFFNGTISLTTKAILPEIKDNERIFLDFTKLNTTYAKIRINNIDVGELAWFPYQLDITEFVWKGENKIEISLTNSLRNLLGELHYVPVLPGGWEQKFSGKSYDGPDWLEKRKNGTVKSWSDDYFFKPLGIEGSVSVNCMRKS